MDFMSTNFDLAENIFHFYNLEPKSLTFVLNWDTKEKFYYNLLMKSFANVIDTPNDHSMVLTRPEEPNYFHEKIPAFDIRYIEDCFKFKDYPDPTKYLIKNTSYSNYAKDDIFDCWLYQKKTWSDLVPIQETQNNICKIENNPSSTNSNSQVTSSHDDVDDIPPSNCSTMVPPVKNTKLPYTHKEEMQIVYYIIKNNYALDIKGRVMWQRMERDNVCRHRTWKSMKQRYLKFIKYALKSGNHRFPFLTRNNLKLLRKGLGIKPTNKDDEEVTKFRFNEERLNNWSSDSS